jgi:outer membrane protein assembly factor BamC
MTPVTRFRPARPLLQATALAAALALAGCSSIDSLVSGDKIDYRSQGQKTPGLEVPPDLTQLSRDARYQQSGGTVSAAAYQANVAAAPTVPQAATTVAPAALGDVRIERQGNSRWLATPLTPEQLWPQLEAFWKDSGFVLATDQPAVGVMETDWAENRAKLSNDPIRGLVGKVLDSLYSTGERDKFRTRVERTANGTEVYISHRGMEEVYSGARNETTVWQPRKPDPQLEAEFLARLMQRLGAKPEAAKAAAATSTTAPATAVRARLVEGRPATLQVDDNFERAWRRVGLALDRGGFTVEDRDRAQGLYFVRYVDPSKQMQGEKGFFSKLFGSKDDATGSLSKFRISVKGDGERSTVAVLDAQGAPEAGEAGKRIVSLLVDDLK